MVKYLISFQRKILAQSTHSPDLGEKLGQWGMGWLSLGFGKHVKVTKINDNPSSGIIFEKKNYPIWKRISVVVAAILLFPISLLLTGIGCIGLACSESHAALTTMYIDHRALKKQPRQTSQNPTLAEGIRLKEDSRENPKEIPPECDIRGQKWLADWDHVFLYAKDCLTRVNPNVRFINTDILERAVLNISNCFDDKLPEAIAFSPLVSNSHNHFTLVYICTKTRTIEYYDSKVNYGNREKIMANLETLAKDLDQKDPGTGYKIVHKIKVKLQPDVYQCGPWVLYFLEQRAQNPDVDFNKLDIKKAQKMIAEFRLRIMDKLIELHKRKQSLKH